MRVRVAARGLLAVCALVTAVGCGSESVSGSPSTASAEAGQPSFDPCTIPDEALASIGVERETEERDVFGVQASGWKICGWHADWYFLDVFSTTNSMDEIRSNPKNTDFAAVQVGDREAISYHEKSDSKREMCDIAFRAGNGTILVRGGSRGLEPAREDPCALAIRSANALDRYIPR